MMLTRCMNAIAVAIGRPLKPGEAAAIDRRMHDSAVKLQRQDPGAWRAKSTIDRALASAEQAAKDYFGEKREDARRKALAISALGRLDGDLSRMAKRGINGLLAMHHIIADDERLRGRVTSVERNAMSIAEKSVGRLLATFELISPKFLGFIDQAEGAAKMNRAIRGETVGDPIFDKAGKLWRDEMERFRQRFNAAGGQIGYLEDFGHPQSHSQWKIARAKFEKWSTDIAPLIDRARIVDENGNALDDRQFQGFLREVYQTLATGGANKVTPGQARGVGMLANRGNDYRVLHFKDADSWSKYAQAYGSAPTLFHSMMGHVHSMARDIAMLEKFGPNPDHMARFVMDREHQKLVNAEPDKERLYARQRNRGQELYNYVAGKAQPVANYKIAAAFDTLKAVLGSSRLGFAIISSLQDNATMHLAAHLNNLPEMEMMTNRLRALDPTNRIEKERLMAQGIGARSFMNVANRSGMEFVVSSWARKITTAVLRAEGLLAVTDARHRAFGATMLQSLGRMVRDNPTLASLHPDDNRILLSKGITERDYAMWRAAEQDDWFGSTILTPESVYRVSDADVEKAASGEFATLRAQGAKGEDFERLRNRVRDAAAENLLSHVNQESDLAVTETNAVSQAHRASIPRGTFGGELLNSMYLFKAFPMALLQKQFLRAMSIPGVANRVAYGTALIALSTVYGMASLQLTEVLNGRDPRQMWTGDRIGRTWIAALLKGGSLGIYGDLLLSQTTQHGTSPLAALAGPVFGEIEDALTLSQGEMVKYFSGDKTDFGAQATRFIHGIIPGQNIWYLKAALDHMIFHNLLEYFSPGYLGRMEARSEKEFGQRYFWRPGKALPERAPDLGRATGTEQ